MKNYKEKLAHITTFIFDFDGVLSDGKVLVTSSGDQLRVTDTKDGYAIQYALKQGFNICILSGGYSESMILRYKGFPKMDIFLQCENKIIKFQEYMKEKNLQKENIVYVGDDIPDYEVMQMAGLKACPADAATEILETADYISHRNGGNGCVRDIIEQTLRAQNKWLKDGAFHW